jgi:hypothetical protein
VERVGRVELALLVVLVGVMLSVSVTAGALEIRRSHDAAEQRDEVLLERALFKASAVWEVLRTTATAQALLDPDGGLEERSFQAYAVALVTQPGITTVAYETRVEDADREEFERSTGLVITERSATGDLVPAETRPVYFPVTYAWPPALRAVAGFDVVSAPLRSAAFDFALASGEPALSAPVTLALDGELGVFAVVPLFAETGTEPVGLITVGYLARDVEDQMVEGFRAGVAVRIVDDGETLVEVGDLRTEMVTGSVEVGGRTWDVSVRHPERGTMAGGLWIGVAGSLFALLVGVVGWILLRQRRDVEDARTRLLGLQTATAAFARTTTPAEVRSIAVAHCASMMGGGAAWVALNGHDVHVTESAGAATRADLVTPELSAHLDAQDSDDPSPVPTEITSADESSTWVFPVAAGSGEAAAVVVSRTDGRPTDADVEVCSSTLVVAGAALRRAAAQERERQIAETLQDQLLAPAPLPPLDGLELAVIYQPASGERFIGGDWYDVVVVDPWRVVISVGDVVGHGVQAAGAMGMLRTASRALAGLVSPANILEQLDRIAKDTSAAFMATALIVEFRLDSMTVCYAAAGHPPPLVVRDDTTERLVEGHGAPLGLSPADGRAETVRDLRAGDRLLFYTDGLIEQNRRDIDKSLFELAAAAAASRASDSATACQHIISEVVGASPNDDIVLLIATLTDTVLAGPLPAGDPDTWEQLGDTDDEGPRSNDGPSGRRAI